LKYAVDQETKNTPVTPLTAANIEPSISYKNQTLPSTFIDNSEIIHSCPLSKKSLLALGKEWLFGGMDRLFHKKTRTDSLEGCNIPENTSAVTLEALALSFYTGNNSKTWEDTPQKRVAVGKNPPTLPKTTLAVSKKELTLLFPTLSVPLQIAIIYANIKIIKDIYRFKPLLRRPPPK